MSADMEDKCLVCLKSGGNLNIFTTYNIYEEKVELYVEVIRNCFNIQIPPDSNLITMCSECGIKLRTAYTFRHSIVEAVNKLLAVQVTVSTDDKLYSQIEYLEDTTFDNDYDINTELNPETGQISYTLQKINDNQEANEVDHNYLIDLENDAIVDRNVDKDIKCKKDESLNDKLELVNPKCQLYNIHKVNGAIIDSQDINLLHEDKIVILSDEKLNVSNNCIKTDVLNKYEASTILYPEAEQVSYILDIVNEEETNQDNLTSLDKEVVENEEVSKNVGKKKRVIKNGTKHLKAEMVKENMPGNVKEDKVENNKRKGKKAKKRKQTLSCEQCDAQFATNRALASHAQTHVTHACGACGLVLPNKIKLRTHERTHEQGPFTCRYCNKEFTNRNTRNAHEWRVHAKQNPFKCSQCDERFKTFLKRLRHTQAAHGVKEQYPCHYCDKKYAYAAYRTKHIRIMHSKERPHKCPQCTSVFARRGGLDSHLASIHGVGELKHQCSRCSRRFYVKSALVMHMNTHIERFSCIQCEQKFKRSADLDTHLKTNECGDSLNISLDFVSSLHLDELPDDYSFLDPCYLDLNEL